MSDAAWEEPSDLIIEQIEIGPMQNYTYLIGCRSTREVVLVDPAWDIDSVSYTHLTLPTIYSV